jgi:4-carboxymuconolactone decarboxylase
MHTELTLNTPRVEPLKAAELSDKQRGYVQRFLGPQGQVPGIFGTLMRNMELFEAWAGFGTYTMTGSRIDARLREVLVLRTAVNLDCEYEWHHHQRIALAVGLSKELVARIRSGHALDSGDQDLMVSCANELAGQAMLSDELWRRMIDRFGLEYTMDVVFTVGAYTALAMGLKSCGVQLEGRK